ncbi:MAG TPA: leucyl aminopeptidase family protein [Stellaceae bacterium]|nr:leucyl aminopeptidase family protein [Stellaceae bacterium]
MFPLLAESPNPVPLTPLTAEGISALDPPTRAWVEATGFKAAPGSFLLVPGEARALERVLVGRGTPPDLWTLASLPDALPEGSYRLDPEPREAEASQWALGWALGAYGFTRYKPRARKPAHLLWPTSADRSWVERLARSITLARDLINTPAEHMGPADLAQAAQALASRHGARVRVVVGDELLSQNYPSIHAVGRASVNAPRLIDIRWGEAPAPLIALIGKGVCFDSGGLDLKTAAGMKMMKKDMGGAATILGLAEAIMAAGLPVRLRVLVPAVENAVAGNAFRPLDVIATRKGLHVEIGNTDAEGRLILADALTEAQSETPALIIDMATLTGAARAALGPELPAMFCNDDAIAEALLASAAGVADPLWRLPLWQPYRKLLNSTVADLNNAPDSPFAGAILAALYLQEFVEEGTPWVHIDTYAWNQAARPGRPEGGEALGLRALYDFIARRFAAR